MNFILNKNIMQYIHSMDAGARNFVGEPFEENRARMQDTACTVAISAVNKLPTATVECHLLNDM